MIKDKFKADTPYDQKRFIALLSGARRQKNFTDIVSIKGTFSCYNATCTINQNIGKVTVSGNGFSFSEPIIRN